MKNRVASLLLFGWLFATFGCGDSAPSLSPVTGVVTYKGDPVAEATVAFQPVSGPVSTGTTDADGKFSLLSKGEAGAVVGPGVFLVSAVEKGDVQTSTGEATLATGGESGNQAEMMMQASAASQEPPKSRIPLKYNSASTSDLNFTIDSDGGKNNFTLELKD